MNLLPIATAVVSIVALMIFGGDIPGTGVIEMSAALGLMLLCCLAFSSQATLRKQPRIFLAGLIGIALLPLLQVVPLPPSWWHSLPGQELRIRTLTLVGIENTWQPLSLTPFFTSGVAVMAVTFVALTMMLIALPIERFRLAAWVIFGLVIINIAIGLVQVATGGQALQFYRTAHQGALLGFYVNKNHVALVLVASLPIAAYLLGSHQKTKGRVVWFGVYAAVAMVAILTTNSRAGLGLGLVTILALASLYARSAKLAYIAAGLGLLIVALFLVSASSAFELVSQRFGYVEEDLRWQFLTRSEPIIRQYWLLGAGIGSFSTVFKVYEQLSWIEPQYLNQLHNEYPQLLIEAGLPGLLVLFAFAAGIVIAAGRIWPKGSREHRLALLMGAIVLALIAIHSAVDYPLRRPAVLPVLALGIALVVRGDAVTSIRIGHRRQRA